jgi:hypothetical protein
MNKDCRVEATEEREMTQDGSQVVAQLLAGWIIREEECRRQNAEIALTTNTPSVTIVRKEKASSYDKKVKNK